jgi:hypothetical protein
MAKKTKTEPRRYGDRVTIMLPPEVIATIGKRARARWPGSKGTRSLWFREVLKLHVPGPANLEDALDLAHAALLSGQGAGPAMLALEEVARVINPPFYAKLAKARAERDP